MVTDLFTVDPANATAARAWDGEEGAFWAANAERFDRSVAGYHGSLLAAAEVDRRGRVLDVGCGTGQTTRDAARVAADGLALGVDLSAAMLAVARRRAAEEGLGHVSFQQADAQVHPFAPGSYDLVLSRTGTMFFADQAAAFANLARALRPGGRLAVLVWQGPGANEWLRELLGALAAGRDLPLPPLGVPGPFAFAEPEHARSVLAGAGFGDVDASGLEAPMWFGEDASEARPFVLGVMGWLLRDLDDPTRERALAALVRTLHEHETPDGVTFASAAWLVTATRS